MKMQRAKNRISKEKKEKEKGNGDGTKCLINSVMGCVEHVLGLQIDHNNLVSLSANEIIV